MTNMLPTVLWTKISSYTDIVTYVALTRTAPAVRRATLLPGAKPTSAVVRYDKTLPAVIFTWPLRYVALHPNSFVVDATILQTVAGISTLTSLHLHGDSVSVQPLSSLLTLTRLTFLDPPSETTSLSALPQLRAVHANSYLRSYDAKHLPLTVTACNVDVGWLHAEVTEELFQRPLHVLQLRVSPSGLPAVMGMLIRANPPTLHTLTLTSTDALKNTGRLLLTDLPHLRTLILSQLGAFQPKDTISPLTSLTIRADPSKDGHQGLLDLCRLRTPHLRMLDFTGSIFKRTADGLACLSVFTMLTTLVLRQCHLTTDTALPTLPPTVKVVV